MTGVTTLPTHKPKPLHSKAGLSPFGHSHHKPYFNCHENTMICLDELYTRVIPAQAGIQDDRSPGSCFHSTDRQRPVQTCNILILRGAAGERHVGLLTPLSFRTCFGISRMLKQAQHDNYGLRFLIIVPLHSWLGWPTSASLTPDPRSGMLKQAQHDNVPVVTKCRCHENGV